MILRHISGYFTSPMKVKIQQKLLRNLGTSFYKSIFLYKNFAEAIEIIAVTVKVRY